MKTILYATTNKGKIRSAQNILSKFNITVTQVDFDIPEIRSDSVSEIAAQKVLYAFKKVRQPVISLDAGFLIYSLNNFPNTFVNFALKTISVGGILKLVEGKDRKCAFKHSLGYMDESLSEPILFTSDVPGELAEGRKGSPKEYFWSDLHYVFIPDGREKTLAEMEPSEYKTFQMEVHKDSCMTQFAKWYVER